MKSGFPDGASCLAELGTIQLEFTRLSEITDDWTYHHVVCTHNKQSVVIQIIYINHESIILWIQ